MAYKIILLHVDDSPQFAERARIAAELAAAIGDTHLIGAAMTGISRYLLASMAASEYPGSAGPFIDQHLDRLRTQAGVALDRFDALMQQSSARSFERRLVEDENFGGLGLQARYADLVILSQFDPDDVSVATNGELPEAVAITGGRPVLAIPYAGRYRPVGGNAMVAWDGSLEATRAVHHALPLLRLARKTHLLVFNVRSGEGVHGEEPGADLALYLARHGVKVEVVQDNTRTDIGSALLSRCADLQTDLLVMGCYGHSRFREIMLGGVTRTVLKSMTAPVLMAH
jgi:nucleotide-binding universal stress UspA family protein